MSNLAGICHLLNISNSYEENINVIISFAKKVTPCWTLSHVDWLVNTVIGCVFTFSSFHQRWRAKRTHFIYCHTRAN